MILLTKPFVTVGLPSNQILELDINQTDPLSQHIDVI